MKDNNNNNETHPLKGQIVLVRCHLAGVHIGTLEAAGQWVVLSNSNRLWSWDGAFTLSEVSQVGVGERSRVSCAVKTMTIPVGDVGEVVNVEPDAYKTILRQVGK